MEKSPEGWFCDAADPAFHSPCMPSHDFTWVIRSQAVPASATRRIIPARKGELLNTLEVQLLHCSKRA